MRFMPIFTSILLAPALVASLSAHAQNDEDKQIILDKVSVVGDVEIARPTTQIEPELQLNEADIASYGVSSLEELLEELSPQISSGRGRSGGQPLILVNGVRIASFREIRNYPPEAIARVDVLPEEAALKYGAGANQRVINFVLKDNYSSWTVKEELSSPTQGDGLKSESELGHLNLKGVKRTSFNFEYETDEGILESERNVTNTQSGEPGWKDSLTAKSRTATLSGSHNRSFGDNLQLTLSGDLEIGDSLQYLGLPEVEFTLPTTNPFSTSVTDETFTRIFGLPGSLRRDTDTLNTNLNMSWLTYIGDWQVTSLTSYSRSETNTLTDRTPDTTRYQDRLNSTTAPVGPNSNIYLLLDLRTEETERISNTLSTNLLFNGSLAELPAGEMNTTLSFDLTHADRQSQTLLDGTTTQSDLDRQTSKVQVSGDIPLISDDMGIPLVETLGLNITASATDYSDFGVLYGADTSLNWSPIEKLKFLSSYSYERGAPSMSQLGDTISVTPNVTVFDYVKGESVLVTTTSGGNPDLEADTRHTMKFSGELTPFDETDLRFRVEYIDSRTENPIGSFSSIDSDLQAVFPDRFVRDANGDLIAYDTRAVNFKEENRRELRFSLNWSQRLAVSGSSSKPGSGPGSGQRGQRPNPQAQKSGPPPEDKAGPPPGDGGAPTKAEAKEQAAKPKTSSARGGRGGLAGGRGGMRGGRVYASLNHTWTLESTRELADGYPLQDFLNGDANGSSGGTSEHQLNFRTGYFKNGVGARLQVDWQSGTDVSSGDSSSVLSFSDLTTTSLRLFYSVQETSYLAKNFSLLKGGRFALSVDNLFDERRTVSDQNGVIPVTYEADRIDPEGRVLEISFRKHF